MPPARFHCNANRDRLANKSPGRGGGRPMQAWERGDAAMMRYAQQAATGLAFRRQGSENPEIHGTFEFRVGQDVKSGQPAITRGLDRLDALCRGRTSAVADVRIFNFPISGEPEIGWQPVKGLDRLSGDWRAIKRAPIALDRLPPPARLHPSDQGRFQGRAPLRLLHPLKIQRGQKFISALSKVQSLICYSGSVSNRIQFTLARHCNPSTRLNRPNDTRSRPACCTC